MIQAFHVGISYGSLRMLFWPFNFVGKTKMAEEQVRRDLEKHSL